MDRKRSILNIILDTAVFILLEIAALDMLSHNSSVQNFFITKSFQGIMGKLWGMTESASRYMSLGKENRQLADEVFRLNKEVSALNRQIEECRMSSLAEEWNASVSGRFGYTQAAIMKNSLNKQHNYMILDKGSEDGIRPQSGIVTSQGAVGIIDAVSRHYSYAISFLNSELSISARIGSEGAAGPMTWDGRSRDGALLKEIPLQYKFEAGDTVYTSGFSSIFPPDIPLGVTGDTRIVNGATYEVKVKLFQDFSTLRYVTVVTNRDIQEIEALEEQENSKKGK